jgi:ATP-dependent DNA helicase RecQ
LAVDDAVRRESGGWAGTGRPWYFDEQRCNALRGVRAAEVGLMRGSLGTLGQALPATWR